MKKIFFSLLLLFFVITSVLLIFVMFNLAVNFISLEIEHYGKIESFNTLWLYILYIFNSIGLCVISSFLLYKLNRNGVIYSIIYSYESYKTNRESKSKTKMESKMNKLQKKINKLNNESDE